MSNGMDDYIPQDLAKIHSEINQAVNHRFLLTAAGITAFALMGKGMIPVDFQNKVEILEKAPLYLGYVSLLWLLFYQSVRLRKIIRAYSTYLIAKGWSTWESDWKTIRHHPSWRYKRIARHDVVAHAIIFLGLSGFSIIIALYNLYVLTDYFSIGAIVYLSKGFLLEPQYVPRLVFAVGMFVNIWTIVMIFWCSLGLKFRENSVLKKWRTCEGIKTACVDDQ